MKFIIDRMQLVNIIAKLQSTVPSKALIPILSNILIEATEDEVCISATDLTVSMRASTSAKVMQEGSITLPARRFFQLVRSLTVPELCIETDEDGVSHITNGSSKFKIHGISRQDYPPFPELSHATSITMEGKTLKKMLVSTSFTVARDDSRQALNGILLQTNQETMLAVGTDGKRLAKITTSINTDLEADLTCIVPLKAVEEMMKLLEDDQKVTLTLMQDKICLEAQDVTLISKLLTGQYPDVERVIPNHEEMHSIMIHKLELMSLLRQVSLFTSETNHSVKLTFKQSELHLQAMSAEIGEGKVFMPIDYSGQEIEIAFNPHYLIDILRHCSDETIDFAIQDSFNPGSIKDSESHAHFVIMPMRLAAQV
jgi:DNA polymerase III subunit beta